MLLGLCDSWTQAEEKEKWQISKYNSIFIYPKTKQMLSFALKEFFPLHLFGSELLEERSGGIKESSQYL